MIGSYYCTFRDSIFSIYHCICNCVPDLMRWARCGEIAAVFAPKPMLIIAGTRDEIFRSRRLGGPLRRSPDGQLPRYLRMGRRRRSGLLAPGMQDHLRVTTDPDYYETNAESVEFWSSGNPLFQPPELLQPATELPADATGTLRDLLDSR